MLTHISLFSGIGGIDIAAGWAGFETVLFCEKDEYCQKVLRKHWPDVPIIGDIRDVKKEVMAESTTQRLQVKQEGKQPESVLYAERGSTKDRQAGNTINQPITLVTGGFPCQPFGVAGKRAGKEDDRYLWPEMLRVIKEFKPTWVVGENVAGIINMALDTVCTDLEGEGYEVQPIVLPACSVNAPHRRYRVFIVAYASRERWGRWSNGDEKGHDRTLQTKRPSTGDKQETPADVTDTDIERKQQSQGNIKEGRERISNSGEDVTNSRCESYGHGEYRGSEVFREEQAEGCLSGWWATEPELGRVAYGVPARVDRLKCLGNAVVPQQIYPILKYIAEIESAGI